MEFKGYKIRKSGKHFFRIYKNGKSDYNFHRMPSIEACKVAIVSRGRVMTRKEHSIVHGGEIREVPTAAQAESEKMVASGLVEGFI